MNGYVPQGYTVEEARELRKDNPKKYVEQAEASMAKYVELMLKFQKMVPLLLTMVIMYVKLLIIMVLKMHLIFLDLFQHTFDRCSVKEKDRSVLLH